MLSTVLHRKLSGGRYILGSLMNVSPSGGFLVLFTLAPHPWLYDLGSRRMCMAIFDIRGNPRCVPDCQAGIALYIHT